MVIVIGDNIYNINPNDKCVAHNWEVPKNLIHSEQEYLIYCFIKHVCNNLSYILKLRSLLLNAKETM